MPQQQAPQQRAVSWFKRLTTPQKVGVGCLSLILLCAICGACGGLSQAISGNTSANVNNSNNAGGDQATLAPTNTAKPKAWHTVQHFTGNQNQQSETFHISSDQWRIVWSDKLNSAGMGSGLFEATLYTSDNQLVDLVANVANQSSGATYNAHVGPGDYYIKIEALYTDYDVQVQEYS